MRAQLSSLPQSVQFSQLQPLTWRGLWGQARSASGETQEAPPQGGRLSPQGKLEKTLEWGLRACGGQVPEMVPWPHHPSLHAMNSYWGLLGVRRRVGSGREPGDVALPLWSTWNGDSQHTEQSQAARSGLGPNHPSFLSLRSSSVKWAHHHSCPGWVGWLNETTQKISPVVTGVCSIFRTAG